MLRNGHGHGPATGRQSFDRQAFETNLHVALDIDEFQKIDDVWA
jgi:hypothetical protein